MIEAISGHCFGYQTIQTVSVTLSYIGNWSCIINHQEKKCTMQLAYIGPKSSHPNLFS